MAIEHKDIMHKALSVTDCVVFCRAGSGNRMTVGTVTRVLPRTVEISYQLPNMRGPQYVFRTPENVVRV